MANRNSDTSQYLQKILSTSNDLWINNSISSKLNQKILRSIKKSFPDLETETKLKILASFINIPHLLAEKWKSELEEIIEVAGRDSESWVSMFAETMKTFPATSSLNTAFPNHEDNRNIFTDIINDLRKQKSSHNGMGMLPLEWQYLNKNVLEDRLPQQEEKPVKHFVIKCESKCATFRTELLRKSTEAQSSLRKTSAPTVPSRSCTMPRKIIPRTAPSIVNTSVFSGSSIHGSYGRQPNVIKTPPGRKYGATKLIELPEQPLGHPPATKRKRYQHRK